MARFLLANRSILVAICFTCGLTSGAPAALAADAPAGRAADCLADREIAGTAGTFAGAIVGARHGASWAAEDLRPEGALLGAVVGAVGGMYLGHRAIDCPPQDPALAAPATQGWQTFAPSGAAVPANPVYAPIAYAPAYGYVVPYGRPDQQPSQSIDARSVGYVPTKWTNGAQTGDPNNPQAGQMGGQMSGPNQGPVTNGWFTPSPASFYARQGH